MPLFLHLMGKGALDIETQSHFGQILLLKMKKMKRKKKKILKTKTIIMLKTQTRTQAGQKASKMLKIYMNG